MLDHTRNSCRSDLWRDTTLKLTRNNNANVKYCQCGRKYKMRDDFTVHIT